MDFAKQVGRSPQVFQCQLEEQRLARQPTGRLLVNRFVVKTAFADGVLEDGRVRGQPGDGKVFDVARQRAVRQQFPGDVVKPERLPQRVEVLGICHRHFSFSASAMPGEASRLARLKSTNSPMCSTLKSAAG